MISWIYLTSVPYIMLSTLFVLCLYMPPWLSYLWPTDCPPSTTWPTESACPPPSYRTNHSSISFSSPTLSSLSPTESLSTSTFLSLLQSVLSSSTTSDWPTMTDHVNNSTLNSSLLFVTPLHSSSDILHWSYYYNTSTLHNISIILYQLCLHISIIIFIIILNSLLYLHSIYSVPSVDYSILSHHPLSTIFNTLYFLYFLISLSFLSYLI